MATKRGLTELERNWNNYFTIGGTKNQSNENKSFHRSNTLSTNDLRKGGRVEARPLEINQQYNNILNIFRMQFLYTAI